MYSGLQINIALGLLMLSWQRQVFVATQHSLPRKVLHDVEPGLEL